MRIGGVVVAVGMTEAAGAHPAGDIENDVVRMGGIAREQARRSRNRVRQAML